MPRILRIINRFNLGGPIHNASYLSAYLPADYETKLIGGMPLEEEVHSGYIPKKLGVEFQEIPEMGRSINPTDDWKAWNHIRKVIKEFKPDIVHTHASKAGALGRTAAKVVGVPVVVHTYHGHVFSGYFSPAKALAVKNTERILAKISDAIITISPLQFDEIVNQHRICAAGKAHIIPLGFDLSKFSLNKPEKRTAFRSQYGIQQDEFVIGIIGRFAPVKNHELFIQSIARLQYITSKKIVAVFMGDGDARKEYEKLTERLFDSNKTRTIFTSWIVEIENVLPGLDIVALTSINEGTPVSLIEAQAAGIPAVATNVGGTGDAVLKDQSALLIDDFNPDSFAGAFLKIIEDDTLRHDMAERGPEFVLQHFHYMRMVNDTRQLYERLIESKKRKLRL